MLRVTTTIVWPTASMRDDRDVEQDVAQVLRVEEARLGDA